MAISGISLFALPDSLGISPAETPPQFPEGKIIRNKAIETHIHIQAPPHRVWSVLTDFPSYPEWNPFILTISKEGPGQTHLKTQMALPSEKPMSFRPQILVWEKDKELRWLGSLVLPFLFDGEHGFRLEPGPSGSTHFLHFERFRGVLIPFFSDLVQTKTPEAFRQMNTALKHRVEKLYPQE
jgi:hypothetical protein